MSEAVSYYRHSGRFWIPGVMMAGLASVPAAIVLGWLYGLANWYDPVVFLQFLVVAAWAAGLGGAIGYLGRLGKIRAPWLIAAITLFAAVISIYVGWGSYLAAFASSAEVELEVSTYDPFVMVSLMSAIAEEGIWSIGRGGGLTPSGLFLWGIWAVEALCVLIGAPFVAITVLDHPYCEESDDWFETVYSDLQTRFADPADALQLAESGDLLRFADLPVHPDGHHLTLSLHASPNGQVGTLSVQFVKVGVDNKGKPTKSADTVVKHLILRGERLDAARNLPNLVSVA